MAVDRSVSSQLTASRTELKPTTSPRTQSVEIRASSAEMTNPASSFHRLLVICNMIVPPWNLASDW